MRNLQLDCLGCLNFEGSVLKCPDACDEIQEPWDVENVLNNDEDEAVLCCEIA